MKTISAQEFVNTYGQDAFKQFEPLSTPPQTSKPFLERAGEFVTRNNLPGSKIGENIGTRFAALQAGLEGNTEGAAAISATAPTGRQIAGDIARTASIPIAAMTPNPASVAGAIGQSALINSVAGAGEAATRDANIARGALVGGAIGAGAGLFSKIIEKGVNLLGRTIGRGGEKITQSIIKPSKVDIEDGFSIETVKKYNLAGDLKTMQAKTDAVMDDLTSQVNAKYANSAARINIDEILSKTIKNSSSAKINTFGSNTSMDNAFNQLKAEVASITADGTVSIPEAVQIKRAAGHFGAWVYGQTDPDSTARQKVYTAFYRQLKEAIENNSEPGVKELNKQISDLIPVMNAIIRRIPVAERNSALSLTDIISLSASTIDPRSLSVFAINQLSKSGVVGKSMMQAAAPIQNAARSAAQPLKAGTTALLAAQTPDTGNTALSQSEAASPQPITEEQARKAMDAAMGISPALGVSKVGITAADIMKDALLVKLREGAPKLSNAVDTKLADEADEFIKFLEETPNPTIAQMNRGLEILKRQGHNVSKLADDIITATRSEYEQARDALGRWTK